MTRRQSALGLATMRRAAATRLLLKSLRPIKKRERPFENRLRAELARRDVLFVKLKPTIVGWPDRLAIGPRRKMRLVEVKREGESIDDNQALVHAELRRRGVHVIVVYGPDVQVAADIVMRAVQ